MVLQGRCKATSSVCESVGISPDFNRPGPPRMGRQPDQMEEYLEVLQGLKNLRAHSLVSPGSPAGLDVTGSELSPQGCRNL